MGEKSIGGPGEVDSNGGTTICRRCGEYFRDEEVQWFPVTEEVCVGICTPCLTTVVRSYLRDDDTAEAVESEICESESEETASG